jgi:hypothetical protein
MSKFINNLLVILTALAFFAQLVIDLSTVNVATSIIILCSALTTLFYLRWTTALETHPLSTFAVFGFSFTTLIGAILVQSATWVSVSADLRQPITTFSWLAIFQIISIVAHMIYRTNMKSSNANQQGLLSRLFDSMAIYAVQPSSVLWIVGVFGLFCALLSKVLPVANGFSFLAWAPFLIPIYYFQIGKDYCNFRTHFLFLVLHLSVIGLLGLFFNSRGTILSGVATLLLLLIISAMRSVKIVSSAVLFRLAVVSILGFAISFPASDLSQAMVIVRAERGKVSPIKLIENTIEVFNDKAKLESKIESDRINSERLLYDEKYIKNSLLARLVTTKFHDNSIFFIEKISDRNIERVISKSVDLLFAALPQPLLDKLNVDIKKENMLFTVGDILSHYAIGAPLGGFKTGSIFAQGLLIFGSLFLLIYFVMSFILFFAIDIFSKRTTDGVVIISAIGMLNIFPTFLFGVTADSIHVLFIGVVRGVIQSAVLYFIAISIARFITKVFSLNALPKHSAFK